MLPKTDMRATILDMEISESDWKLLRKKLPVWQEAYIEKLIQEYIKLLSGEGNAATRFWELDQRIREDRHHIGVVVKQLRRSNAFTVIYSLISDGVIDLSGLDGFSEELRMEFQKS